MVRYIPTNRRGTVIGRVQLNLTFMKIDAAYLSALFVDHEWRRRGLATQLMQAAIDFTYDTGITKLALDVYPGNLAALNLYAKLGFVVNYETYRIRMVLTLPDNPRPCRKKQCGRVIDFAIVHKDGGELVLRATHRKLVRRKLGRVVTILQKPVVLR